MTEKQQLEKACLGKRNEILFQAEASVKGEYFRIYYAAFSNLQCLKKVFGQQALVHVWFHCISVVIWNVIFMILICSLDIS